MTPIAQHEPAQEQVSKQQIESQQDQIPFGEFLFKRLQQVKNVKSIFGVPGDFNLGLLEHLYTTKLNWIGGCNELNSGYAADGYSRYTNSLGVLITTYGVGELSAMNAIAGAFAEYSKVLHIVGLPKRNAMNNDSENYKHLHHLVPNIDSLKKSDHYVYTKMVDDISCVHEIVEDPSKAVEQVDRVIKSIFKTSRPGYLFLPLDMANELVDASKLYNEPASTFHLVKDHFDSLIVDEISNQILEKIYQSKNPSILGDVLVNRYDQGVELLREFVNLTKFNNYTTFMAKSTLDESNPNFIGDYIGRESTIGIKENFESSDLILYFGPFINEINTGHYSFDLKEETLILLHPDYIKIGSQIYHGVHFLNVLSSILIKLDLSKIPSNPPLKFEIKQKFPNVPSKAAISQSVMLKKFEQFIQPNDVVVCETGSFMFGIPDVKFKSNVKYIAQGFYLSIGMALPCSTGVGIAMRDCNSNSRLILIEGDGSAQMTVQEISSFVHYGLTPIIFLLNNNGYTVERIIEGETRDYNDIKPWNWSKIFELFEYDDPSKEKLTLSKIVSNEQELTKAFASIDSNPNKLRFHEVLLDQMDCPWRFHLMNNYRLFPKNVAEE